MNYCQLFCWTIQRLCNGGEAPILPSEYKQVEYLQADGNQYIVTSVPIAPETETRCTGEFISGTGAYTSLVGGRNNNGTNGRYIPLGVAGGANNLRFVYSSHEPSVSSSPTSKHSVVFNDAEHKAYLDDELKATFTSTLSTTNQQNVTLFGMSGYNDSNVSYKAKGRLYSVSFYNNTTGDKLGDYIPCYRKSDNKPGMYDIVTNTFFTNQGTGEFTVGNNV